MPLLNALINPNFLPLQVDSWPSLSRGHCQCNNRRKCWYHLTVQSEAGSSLVLCQYISSKKVANVENSNFSLLRVTQSFFTTVSKITSQYIFVASFIVSTSKENSRSSFHSPWPPSQLAMILTGLISSGPLLVSHLGRGENKST